MEKTLRSTGGDDRVRAYIVWLPIFGGDFTGEPAKLSASFKDKREAYFLDSQSLAGWLWNRVMTRLARYFSYSLCNRCSVEGRCHQPARSTSLGATG